MIRFVALLASLLAILVALPARADLARPVHEKRLANGLRVVVSPDPAGADVSLLVHYDVGSGDEPTSLEGLAHLVEHLMFLGSKHVPRGRFYELLDRAGATNVNGHTYVDRTTYHETLPPERLELGLWLESDRMGYLLDSLDGGAFKRALAEVENEYRARVTEAPLGAAETILYGELFPAWHPYHHLPMGTPESLGALTLADARAFAATWYGPANAIVVIAGKVDPAAAMALAERYFGSLPARPPPARPTLPALVRKASTFAWVAADVAREEVRAAWVTPPSGTPDDLALDVAAAILAGRGAGWLNKVLTGRERLAVKVGAAQDSHRVASVFEVRAVVAEGHTPQQVLEKIGRALAQFDTGVSDAELERAKRLWRDAHLFGLESSLAWADRLVHDAKLGPLPARFDGLAYHAAVRSDDVRRAVRTWLRQQPAVFVVPFRRSRTPVSGVLVGKQEVAR